MASILTLDPKIDEGLRWEKDYVASVQVKFFEMADNYFAFEPICDILCLKSDILCPRQAGSTHNMVFATLNPPMIHMTKSVDIKARPSAGVA